MLDPAIRFWSNESNLQVVSPLKSIEWWIMKFGQWRDSSVEFIVNPFGRLQFHFRHLSLPIFRDCCILFAASSTTWFMNQPLLTTCNLCTHAEDPLNVWGWRHGILEWAWKQTQNEATRPPSPSTAIYRQEAKNHTRKIDALHVADSGWPLSFEVDLCLLHVI